jgi:hypothetical protein
MGYLPAIVKWLFCALFAYTAPRVTHLAICHPEFQDFIGYQPNHNAAMHNAICAFVPVLVAMLVIRFPSKPFPTPVTPARAVEPPSNYPPGMQVDIVQKKRKEEMETRGMEDRPRMQLVSVNGLRVRPRDVELVKGGLGVRRRGGVPVGW